MNLSKIKDGDLKEVFDILENILEIAGRTIREIIMTNPTLINRIILILTKHMQAAESSLFVRNMSEETGLPTSEILKWLNKLLCGVEKI